MPGIPFIISAPSGAGKTTLCKLAVEHFPQLRHSISYTTRPPRAGETDGVEYWFIDDGEFDRMLEHDEFIEYAGVYGKRYGTSKKDLEALLREGVDILLEIDVQGAMKVRQKLSGGVFIFIMPPSLETCGERLLKRGKDTPEAIEKRLAIAVEEIRLSPRYDYIIMNDTLEAAFTKLKSVIIAEKSRAPRIIEGVKDLYKNIDWK